MNIDNLFINKLLNCDIDIVKHTMRTIPVEMVQGSDRPVYKFIKTYYRDSKGEIPTLEAIQSKFPDFEENEANDSLKFYTSELRNRVQYQDMTKGTTEMQNKLFSKDVEGARKILHDMQVKLASYELTETDTPKKGFAERKRDYVDAKKNKGKIGLQTGIKAIDDRIGGIQDEMIIIMAPRGKGKSNLALMITANIWSQINGNIVIVTNEMSKKKILARLDSIVGHFSYSAYRKGKLTKEEEQRFLALKDTYAQLPDLYVIPGAGKSVEDIEYELISLEPKLLIVDGLYLTDMGFNDPYRDTTAASRAYQKLTKKYSLPAIFTTQMTAENETKYSRAIEEDADIVFQMVQNPAMKDAKVMKLNFTKIREEDSDLEVYMNWDYDRWNFTEIEKSEADLSAEQTYE